MDLFCKRFLFGIKEYACYNPSRCILLRKKRIIERTPGGGELIIFSDGGMPL